MTHLLSDTIVYGGRLKDRKQLLSSSSGGAFTALSDVFLNNGDAIACSTYNFETHQQEFRIIEKSDDRNLARGSKYMQSIPADIYIKIEQYLSEHPMKKLLFFGMGCQSAGFIKYAEIKGFIDRVTVVDIICHGSSSPQIWKEFAESLEKRKGKIKSLNFRDKRRGWNRATAVAKIGDKEVFLGDYLDVYYSCNEMRPSCHKCPYTSTERYTDLTIGDFWHIENTMPNEYNEDGTSLFLIHTEKGRELFEAASSALHWFSSDVTNCLQMNLERPTSVSKSRNEFWKDYYKHGIDFVIKKYSIRSNIGKIIQKISRKLIRND